MIKTLIFDLGKVIIPFDFHRAYERLGPLCRYDAKEIPARLRSVDIVQRLETGLIEPEEFLREFSRILEFECDYDQFREIFASIFMRETLFPDSMFAALRERYRLVLLSNTNAIHYEFIEREYPLIGHFHEHVLSHRVGALKPSPKIYEAAIRAAQCAPNECFFTDDIPDYVEAARTHGIDAVTFESREQIERELRNRGVQW
jgi:putative hydrolase of the HAD superfamily